MYSHVHSDYEPDILFGKVTMVSKGESACQEPKSYGAGPFSFATLIALQRRAGVGEVAG